MNKQLCLGHKVIQGYLDSKNPNDTWVSGNYSISYWISNRLFQLPRHYLGLNCQLGGTGFTMRTDTLKELGWGATCLTEDLEFSIRLVLNGSKVSWSHEAVVYDEKPLLLSQSWMQRKRWMQGHCDCAGRYLKKLIVKTFKDGDKVAMDLALYLIQPFIIVLNGFGMIYALVQFITTLLLSRNFFETMGLPAISTSLFYVAAAYINIIFIHIEGKLSFKMLKNFIIFPLYSLTWVPIIIQGFHERNNREWFHTAHTRSLDIQEIEGAEELG
jgi:cellulose synthase/poly-beta-1,6-N-acetylglucosamine synthase-like glycosyltransferase